MRAGGAAGFTLLEVVIAVAILGISLTALLQAQVQSLDSAGRSRDMTVATLLARGKMIDIEQHLFHDGFQAGTEAAEGDFRDLGHAEVDWHWRISEVEFDLNALMSLCGGADAALGSAKGEGEGAKAGDEGGSCAAMLGTLTSMLGNFTEQLGRSLRAVELSLSWPQGRHRQSLQLRALLSRDDFATEQDAEMIRGARQQGGLQPSGPQGAVAPGGLR